jgi:hypothetical protein
MRSVSSRTALFLMELTLVILFFALSAAVGMQVFAAAKSSADGSRDLSAAVLAAESAAECWKASGGDLGACAELMGAEARDGVLTQSFGGDWQRSGEEYTLTLSPEGATASIKVEKTDGKEIYALAARALGGEGA